MPDDTIYTYDYFRTESQPRIRSTEVRKYLSEKTQGQPIEVESIARKKRRSKGRILSAIKKLG
jgi:hypothetical protein